MNDIELLNLSRDIYQQTGWDSNSLDHYLDGEVFTRPVFESDVKADRTSYCPLYTSDYLLDKLPAHIDSHEYEGEYAMLWTRKDDHPYDAEVVRGATVYYTWYTVIGMTDGVSDYGVHGDTPLKSLLRMVLELSRTGEGLIE